MEATMNNSVKNECLERMWKNRTTTVSSPTMDLPMPANGPNYVGAPQI